MWLTERQTAIVRAVCEALAGLCFMRAGASDNFWFGVMWSFCGFVGIRACGYVQNSIYIEHRRGGQ